jgi:hypothetical protein
MRHLEVLKVQMLATPDEQISLTDPDSRSMATSGRGLSSSSSSIKTVIGLTTRPSRLAESSA